MEIEAALMISGISLAFGIYTGISNLKRTEKNDAKMDASQLTTVIVKLETIGTGVAEIKSEMSGVKTEVRDIRDRLIKVESSASSAHKRLDTCEKYCKRFNETDERGDI